MKRITMILMLAALAGLQTVATFADDKTPDKKRDKQKAAKSADVAADDQEEAGLVESPLADDTLATDPAFDRYVDLNVLGIALNTADSGLLTDVTLQLAEGERILLRERKSMSASAMAQLATKLAIAKNDKEALQRLVKFAKARGNDKLAQQVSAAEKLAAPSRSAAVDLSAADPDDAAAYQRVHDQITAGRLLQDWAALDDIENELRQLQELPKKLNDELIAYASKDKKLRGTSRVLSQGDLLRLSQTMQQAGLVQQHRVQYQQRQQYINQQPRYGYQQPQTGYQQPRSGYQQPQYGNQQQQQQFTGRWYSNQQGETELVTIRPGGSASQGTFTWVSKDQGVVSDNLQGTVRCYNNRSVLTFVDQYRDIYKYDVEWGRGRTNGRIYIKLRDQDSSDVYTLWKQ